MPTCTRTCTLFRRGRGFGLSPVLFLNAERNCTIEPRKGRRTRKVKAWIQMGCERREVTFDVSEAEIERVGKDGLEM